MANDDLFLTSVFTTINRLRRLLAQRASLPLDLEQTLEQIRDFAVMTVRRGKEAA